MAPAAVIFDLDGVLIDSERTWNDARREVALAAGGRWPPEAQQAMMGMSSTEWSAYMHAELGVAPAPQEISEAVVARLLERYRRGVPLLPGASESVKALAGLWRLGLASSANRTVIDLVLEELGLAGAFAASVSSEEVARGKPAPDVYLECAQRLAAAPGECVAVEDSANGLRSAAAAGMAVVAVPNREYPPGEDALGLADEVVPRLTELTPALIERAAARRTRAARAPGAS